MGDGFGDWETAWSLAGSCALVVVFFVLAPIERKSDVVLKKAERKNISKEVSSFFFLPWNSSRGRRGGRFVGLVGVMYVLGFLAMRYHRHLQSG